MKLGGGPLRHLFTMFINQLVIRLADFLYPECTQINLYYSQSFGSFPTHTYSVSVIIKKQPLRNFIGWAVGLKSKIGRYDEKSIFYICDEPNIFHFHLDQYRLVGQLEFRQLL